MSEAVNTIECSEEGHDEDDEHKDEDDKEETSIREFFRKFNSNLYPKS